MSANHKINRAYGGMPSGDVIKYFQNIKHIIEDNDGTHDCKIITSDAYSPSCPIALPQFTKLKLTDPSVDIVNIDKGYVEFNVDARITLNIQESNHDVFNDVKDLFYVFVGLKSALNFIDQYKIYSNGRLTSAQQTRAIYETMAVRAVKPDNELHRPGMYTRFEDVKKMSDCVCGTYLKLSELMTAPVDVTFNFVAQIDDLLPFSAMEYYPRCAIEGDLELEIKQLIHGNFVWCPVSVKTGAEKLLREMSTINPSTFNTAITKARGYEGIMAADQFGNEFCQCDDYMKIILPVKYAGTGESDTNANTLLLTPFTCSVSISNPVITQCKSYIHGFNISDEAIRGIREVVNQAYVLPAQWIDVNILPQNVSQVGIRGNTVLPLNNATALILTYPRTGNQITVSKNPLQDAISVHVGDKIIPDKVMSTTDRCFAEMMLENNELDTLWQATPSFLRGFNEEDAKDKPQGDATDFCFVANLERFSNGMVFDGITDNNCQITVSSNHLSASSPYAKPDGTHLNDNHVNVLVLSDCYWIITPEGLDLVK